jgi:hypothetical protein
MAFLSVALVSISAFGGSNGRSLCGFSGSKLMGLAPVKLKDFSKNDGIQGLDGIQLLFPFFCNLNVYIEFVRNIPLGSESFCCTIYKRGKKVQTISWVYS